MMSQGRKVAYSLGLKTANRVLQRSAKIHSRAEASDRSNPEDICWGGGTAFIARQANCFLATAMWCTLDTSSNLVHLFVLKLLSPF